MASEVHLSHYLDINLDHLLRLGFDLGTGKIQIDAQHVQGADTRADVETATVCLKNQKTYIEQSAILLEDGKVIYGTFDIEEAIAADPTLQDEVLELWKLALHPEFSHLDEVKHVKEVLSAKNHLGSVQEFMAHQLRTIIRDIREHFKKTNLNAGKDARYWDNIPLEIQISVPAMWGDLQRGFVCRAAQKAIEEDGGKGRVQLREEPLCVATVYMLSLVKSSSIKVGECLLLIDCGKGTLDIATVRLLRAPSEGVLMQLQRVGPCSGNGAGSHMINTQFQYWIDSGNCKEVQDFANCCAQLGITEREFFRQSSKEIDRIKKDIHNTRYDFSVTIHSIHGEVGPDHVPRLIIELPRPLILSWFKTWTNAAAQLVREHLDAHSAEQYRCASLTGGGSASDIFWKEMQAVLSQAPYKISIGTTRASVSACSEGALLQHYFEEDKLPPIANFYLARTEEYDAAIHPDAAPEGRIERSEFVSNTKVVHDRLTRVMRYEDGRFSDSEKIPLLFLEKSDDVFGTCMNFNIYYSEEELEDHSPLPPGIHRYPLIFQDVGNLADQGFKIKRMSGRNGARHYELRTYVQLHGNDDRLEMTVYAMRHNYRYPGEYRGMRFTADMVLFSHTQVVWDKSCSHFVRDATGIAEPKTTVSKRKRDASSNIPSKYSRRITADYDRDYTETQDLEHRL